MEQRPLRLGDIVDDYCTRERRVTNHVIVVLTEDVIRQTRCTTCDNEHAYRAAKEPRLRKKPGAETLYDQVLSNVAGASNNEHRSATPEPMTARDASSDAESGGPDEAPGVQEAWVSHRTLIRASLPKSDNTPPEPRPIPEFTMYQRPQPRGRNFRFGGHQRPFGGHQHGNGHGNGNGEANGNVNGNANGNRAARGGFDGPPGQPSGRPGRRRRRRR